MEMTKEQQLAVTLRGQDLLVAAAAGSGKTHVLVKRIVERITKPGGSDVDRLLIVTFTEAAAAEMRQRLSDAIYALLAEDPDDAHLQKQAALLPKAHISTIHSFCQRVIRQHVELLDLDPGFRVGDSIEMKLLAAEVMAALFEDAYAAEDNAGFLNIADAYGGTKTDDKGLAELVAQLDAFLCNVIWREAWISEHLAAFKTGSLDFWANAAAKQARETAAGLLERLEGAKRLAREPDGPSQYLDALLDDEQFLQALLDPERSFAELYILLDGHRFTALSRKKPAHTVSPEKKEMAKAVRDDVKAGAAGLKAKFFFKSPEGLMADIRAVFPAMRALCKLAEDFRAAYQAAKRERNLVDFNDLERFCLEILLDASSSPSCGVPSQAAKRLSEKFDEILIDEYQDINAVQELILSLLAAPGNRFMVGDIKQSIYRFRRANPEIFLAKYNTFTGGENGRRIDLFRNFRSRACVLAGINFLFEQLMTPEVGDIAYDANVALYPGAGFPASTGKRVADSVEVALIDADGSADEEESGGTPSKTELEARFAAKRIKALTAGDEALFVWDKAQNGYRKAEYRDIVILMRALKGAADVFADVFKQEGVPLLTESGQGYYFAVEVATMLSFLQIIDNPMQDVPLLTVLRSPVYAFDADTLLSIRQAKTDGPFFEAMLAFKDSPECVENHETAAAVNQFFTDLENWRAYAVFHTVSALISKIYTDTDYPALAGAMPGGTARQANLAALLEKSAAYEKTSYKGLFHFNQYIDRLQKNAEDEDAAKLFSESENVVRLMSVHKSKGLEYPVVFVCGLGRQFNLKDGRGNLLLHQALGFGPAYVDVLRRLKTKTLAAAVVAETSRVESLSEEMRLLYVALTRAKEALILTGAARGLGKRPEALGLAAGRTGRTLPVYDRLSAECYLDWLLPALARHPDCTALTGEAEPADFGSHYADARFNLKMLTPADIEAMRANDRADSPRALEPARVFETEAEDSIVAAKLGWAYPDSLSTVLPAKLSISEIKRLHQLEDGATPYFEQKPVERLPAFLEAGRGRVTGTRLGTLVHTVMEHLDVKAVFSAEQVRSLVDSLCERRFFTREEADAIPLPQIANFLASPLAERMRKAEALKREVPFVMAVPAGDIYKGPAYAKDGRQILVHGIIDCYFIEKDANGRETAVLVDYKSDHAAAAEDVNGIVKKYEIQLSLYKKALEKSLRLTVRCCFLHLFAINHTVSLD